MDDEQPAEVKVAPKRGRKQKKHPPGQPEGEPMPELEPGISEALIRIPSVYSDDEIKQIQNFAQNLKIPKKTAIIAQKHIQKNKAAKRFFCSLCDYNAGNKSAYNLHMHSKKHTSKQMATTNTLPLPQ